VSISRFELNDSARPGTLKTDSSPSVLLRYGVALGATGLVLLVALALSREFASPAPLLLFSLGVILTAGYGGLGPGLLATGLSLLAGSYFFLEPMRSFAVEQPTDWVRLVVFAITGIVVSWLFEAVHTARRRAEAEARNAELRHSELEAHIMERERAEAERGRLLEQLGTERARLNLAQKAARIGFFEWIIPTNENVWSEELEALYGLPPGGFGGGYEGWRQCVHPEDLPRAEEDVQRSLADGEFFSEWRAVWPDGGVHWLRAQGKVLFDEAGRPERMIGINMDVTRRREAEESLRQRTEELQEADRRKDEFLAMLAHELRNPLAPLHNTLELLALQGDDPAAVAVAREVMERQVRQMVRLVDDLLDVSRITRGKIALRKAPVDLAAVVATAVDTSRPLIEARRHTLTISLPERPVRIEADAARLAQVLANLLNNAAKYTEVGGRIDLTAERADGEIVLRVGDNGTGISPEMLPRIFDLFTQAESGLDRAQGGLGIGLTLARRLVEMHGGTVEAASDGPGRGSDFVVRLPVLTEPAAEAAAGPAKSFTGRPAADGSRRVLVVDDNVDSAESLALLLELYGHDVRLAHDGLTALEEVWASAPDVVLLDIGLPKMDGYAVARRLREEPSLAHVRLIAMTGYGQEEDRLRAREAGFDHHLVKPVDLDSLRELLAGSEPPASVSDAYR
jgi:PAS domain S-box-containing protein